MITSDMLRVYERYDGDIDMFARVGSKAEKALLSDADFGRIDRLIQNVVVVERGLAAESLTTKTEEVLIETFPEPEVRARFKRLALETVEGPKKRWWEFWR